MTAEFRRYNHFRLAMYYLFIYKLHSDTFFHIWFFYVYKFNFKTENDDEDDDGEIYALILLFIAGRAVHCAFWLCFDLF